MRVVLDTNVLISGILTANGTPGQILEIWRNRKFELLVSDYLFYEVVRVISYPRIRKNRNFAPEEFEALFEAIRTLADWIQVGDEPDVPIRDLADRPILALALHGNAQFLVTGDNDLLTLDAFGDIRIITPSAFLAWVQQPPPE